MAITDANYASLGNATTDINGYYQTSIPATSGYHIWAGKTVNNLFTFIPKCQTISGAVNDFTLSPGVNLILLAYGTDGHLLRNREFMAATASLVYGSGLNGEAQSSYFSATYDAAANWDWNMALPTLVVSPALLYAVHLEWEIPDFGKVLIEADNGGKGYSSSTPGDSISININYESARTSVYALQNYSKTTNSADMQTATLQLQKAQVLIAGSQMAGAVALLTPCLQLCLQNLETTVLSSTQQDINAYREGDLTINVVDSKGRAVSKAQVSYQQTSHDFQFGANPLGANGIYDASVAQIMKQGGFNQTNVTVRWGLIETSPGKYNWSNIDDVQQINTLIGQGFSLVGALALWNSPLSDFTPQYLVYSVNFNQLTSSVDAFAYALAKRYVGKINVWEINEINLASANTLGLNSAQRLALALTFQKAVKRANPNALILNNSTALRYESNDNVDFLNLLKSGAPADIVGLELYYSGMFSNGYLPPQLTLSDLSDLIDSYSALGKLIYITELCVPSVQIAGSSWWQSQWSEATQAEYVKELYTLMFSKRYVQAITWGWGVLDSDAWTVSGGLLTDNKTPKAAYTTIKSLINSWTTQGNTSTGVQGTCSVRGFAGNYQVSATVNGKTYKQTVHITEQKTQTITIKIG